jgi:hypothetical protein
MTVKKLLRTILYLILLTAISSCSRIGRYTDNSLILSSYFHKKWFHSYEGKSQFNSKIQIYRPLKDVTQINGYTMRYVFNEDGSCLFLALKKDDHYKMETCHFTYKNKTIYINDTSTTGGHTLKKQSFEIIELTPKKMVILSQYKLP